MQDRLSLPDFLDYTDDYKDTNTNHKAKLVHPICSTTLFLIMSVAIVVIILIITTSCCSSSTFRSKVSGTAGIPILIPYLEAASNTVNGENEIVRDLGGWLTGGESGAGRRRMPNHDEESRNGQKLGDHGGLVFLPVSRQNFRRRIRLHDNLLYHQEKESQMEGMNQEYISKRHWFDDELEEYDMNCRRVNWEQAHYPLCTLFHEVDMSRIYDEDLAKRSGDQQAGETFYLRWVGCSSS